MRRLALPFCLWALVGCGSGEASTSQQSSERLEPPIAPSPVEPREEPAPAEQRVVTVERHACETEEEGSIDVAQVLAIAIASMQEEAGDAPLPCDEAFPVCSGRPDGSRCVYQLGLYPDVIRVTVWPRAEDGAVVHAEAALERDLSGQAVPPRLEAHRWAVTGDVRCEGERDQRSYGGGPSGAPIGPVTTSRVRFTCDNPTEASVPIRVVRVRKLDPRPGDAVVLSFEPGVLAPRSRTSVAVTIEPTSLALRTDNPFRIDVEIDGRMVSPVAAVVTPERHRLRR